MRLERMSLSMSQGARFNPHEHLMQIKNKNGASDYLPVQWRLVWFREACPDGTIETEMLHLDLDKEMEEETYVWNQEKKRSEKVVKVAKGVAIFRATVKDGKGGVAIGTKMEKAVSFPDFLEKSETGAIGRALAALGYGTQFAPELSEGDRIVDSPVEAETPRLPAPTRSNGQQQGQMSDMATTQKTHRIEAERETEADGRATDQQRAAIANMAKSLGIEVALASDTTFEDASAKIAELQQQIRQRRAAVVSK